MTPLSHDRRGAFIVLVVAAAAMFALLAVGAWDSARLSGVPGALQAAIDAAALDSPRALRTEKLHTRVVDRAARTVAANAECLPFGETARLTPSVGEEEVHVAAGVSPPPR